MAHYPSMSHSNMVRFVHLPGRDLLVAGGIIALVTALVMTSSSQMARLTRQDHSKRQEIHGTVRYQGELLSRGRICFLCQIVEPDMEIIDAKADIVDGQFHIPKALGPMPGWFLVRIQPEGLPSSHKSLSRPMVMCRQYDDGPVRVPRGADMFVRLHHRKMNRFEIELEEPGASAVGHVASHNATL